jgi:hypothetical protein
LKRRSNKGDEEARAVSAWSGVGELLDQRLWGIGTSSVSGAASSCICHPLLTPDLNPIEGGLCNIEHILRKIGTCTKETLIEAIGQQLGVMRAQDVGRFFTHCRYRTPAQQL